MNSVDNVRRALTEAQLANQHFAKAASILSCGPSTYYFEKIEEYVTALFDRFAPFKVADRVALTAAPAIESGSGWYSSRHFLVAGAIATVCEVDYHKGKFYAGCVFDDESWIDSSGQVKPIENKHSFCLPEDLLKRLESEDRLAGGGE